MQATAIFVLAFAALPSVLAFCCDGPQCADGTSGTPCCGYKKCNIFCCACGGKKCRGGKRELLSSFEQRDPSVEAFAQADVAGNGNLTLDRKSRRTHHSVLWQEKVLC